MSNRPTTESFLKNVATHELTILRDDGIYRHIRMQRPDTRNRSFDLLTWPCHLCYTGDMGTYVFCRTHDMFEFFRPGDYEKSKGGIYINPCYWGEKLQATDCSGTQKAGAKKFSQEKFRESVLSYVDNHLDGNEDEQYAAELRQAIDEEVLSASDEWEAVAAIRDFSLEGFDFVDFWERPIDEFTYRFLWACHAIPWAIEQYDKAKKTVSAAVTA